MKQKKITNTEFAIFKTLKTFDFPNCIIERFADSVEVSFYARNTYVSPEDLRDFINARLHDRASRIAVKHYSYLLRGNMDLTLTKQSFRELIEQVYRDGYNNACQFLSKRKKKTLLVIEANGDTISSITACGEELYNV